MPFPSLARTRRKSSIQLRPLDLPLEGVIMYNPFHVHRFGEWRESYGNNHYWNHAKTTERTCVVCGESELQLLELDCSTKKRTGEYCHWCKPWAHRWYEMIDKSRYTPYTKVMPKYKTGHKYNEPLTKRNQALYEYIEEGHTYAEASKKFDVTRARAFQICRTYLKKLQQPA